MDDSLASLAPWRQWLVLLVFALNSGANAFLSMNFAVVSDLAQEVLEISEVQVNWLYSGMLLTVLVGMPFGLLLVTWWEGAGFFFSVSMNTLGAIIRWLGVTQRLYGLVLLSSVLIGAGAWTILPMPAQLSQQRFPKKIRTLTTSLGVQANYTGWLFGAFLPPMTVKTGGQMEDFLFGQSIFLVVLVFAFLAFYRSVPRSRPSTRTQECLVAAGASSLGLEQPAPLEPAPSAHEARPPANTAEPRGARSRDSSQQSTGIRGVWEFAKALRSFPGLTLEIVAYGTLGGVSFAVPAVFEPIFRKVGIPSHVTSWINVTFIGVGVASGIVLGFKCNEPVRFGATLRALFVVVLGALVTLALFVNFGVLHGVHMPSLAATAVISALAGGASLGFIGIGIEAASRYPVSGTHVCFAVEVFVQLVAAVLSQCTFRNGLVPISTVTLLATLLLLAGYRQPDPC